MAYRNLHEVMPPLDDILMQILGMNEVLANGKKIGWWTFENHRPLGWPPTESILRFYGFASDKSGWNDFLQMPRKQRRPRPDRPDRKVAKWCKVCGDLNIYGNGRCHACYKYYRRHRKDRPDYRWSAESSCKTCGIPLASLSMYGSKRKQTAGYCQPCYTYIHRCGQPRPRHLWGAGEFGWCICGYPAVSMVEEMPVCNRHRE